MAELQAVAIMKETKGARRRLSGEHVAQFEQHAGTVEVADPQARTVTSCDRELAALVVDRDDLVERNRQFSGAVPRQQKVKSPELQLARMSKAVAFLPPDGVGLVAHVAKDRARRRRPHPQSFRDVLRKSRTCSSFNPCTHSRLPPSRNGSPRPVAVTRSSTDRPASKSASMSWLHRSPTVSSRMRTTRSTWCSRAGESSRSKARACPCRRGARCSSRPAQTIASPPTST